MCEAAFVAMWPLPQILLSVEEPVLQGSFLMAFANFSVIFRCPYQSYKNRGIKQSPPAEPHEVEGIHMTGCCPVPRRDRLRHCYHYLSAMQPSARCLTPWLQWTRALFAVLGRYHPPRRGYLGLDFGGGTVSTPKERTPNSCILGT
jgi:hypothetical protein